MKRLFILLALLLSGCAVQRQTVRVEVNAPAARPDKGTMAAIYELEVR